MLLRYAVRPARPAPGDGSRIAWSVSRVWRLPAVYATQQDAVRAAQGMANRRRRRVVWCDRAGSRLGSADFGGHWRAVRRARRRAAADARAARALFREQFEHARQRREYRRLAKAVAALEAAAAPDPDELDAARQALADKAARRRPAAPFRQRARDAFYGAGPSRLERLRRL